MKLIVTLILICLLSCNLPSELQKVSISVSGTPEQPINIGIGNFFPFGVKVHLIDTFNAKIEHWFIPGEIVSINHDTSFRLFYSDSLSIEFSNEQPIIVRNSNSDNTKYNRFYDDLSFLISPIHQRKLDLLLVNQDSILKNENFICSHLSKSDSIIKRITDSLYIQYEFPSNKKAEILSNVLETKKLSFSYWHFINSIPKIDSQDILNQRLIYYINRVNQQKISIFSQKDVSLLIESVSYQLLQKSVHRIKEKEELEDYYTKMKLLFQKGSICYDYLVSSLEVQAKKNKILLKRPILHELRIDSKKSIFKKYVQSKYPTLREELTDLTTDKDLYDVNFKSTDLSDIITKFKNKPLLIDFWASWCSPCLKKFPELTNYKNQYPNLNLLFISLDRSQDVWKSFLYNRDLMEFMHYRRNYNNQNTLFQKIYEIPKYGLLQKNGQIELLDEITETTIKKYYETF